jgi:hypothetical protein
MLELGDSIVKLAIEVRQDAFSRRLEVRIRVEHRVAVAH